MTKPFRTLEVRPNADSLVKPGELVDLVEVTPLTLNDRRIYNQLLENAWDMIDKPVVHSISKAQLRGSHNSNDRVGESIERLMRAIVRVRFVRDGQSVIERVQLLGGNLEFETPDGMLHYEIPSRLRTIISNSTIFARLQKEVMFAISSKYALTLYEMVQKRRNLAYRSSEQFTLDEIRGILGVPKGKLTTWSNLNNRAIQPAAQEVSQISDCVVDVQPVKQGRRIVAVTVSWMIKDSRALGEAAKELTVSKVGRKARRSGNVGNEFRPDHSDLLSLPRGRTNFLLRSETYDTARLRYPGYDIYAVEREWRRWAVDKESPRDPEKAYLAFFRTYAENNAI